MRKATRARRIQTAPIMKKTIVKEKGKPDKIVLVDTGRKKQIVHRKFH